MRPVRTIAALLFAALVGMITLDVAPAWAGPVAIYVNPSSVVAGDTVTLSGSVGPDSAGSECAGHVTLISKAFVHTYDFAGLPAVVADVTPGGAFSATTAIARSKAAGTYTITGRCGGANLGVSATMAVRAAPVTDPAPPAPPAPTPAPNAPPATGPSVNQPAMAAPAVAVPPTQPAAQLASRWVIPGLAALGSGTLAALVVWLLYRRRRPAGPSRQGRSGMAH